MTECRNLLTPATFLLTFDLAFFHAREKPLGLILGIASPPALSCRLHTISIPTYKQLPGIKKLKSEGNTRRITRGRPSNEIERQEVKYSE